MSPQNPIVEKMGKTREEHLELTQYLANLMSIKVNDFEIFQRFKRMTSGVDTTAQKLKLDPLEPGYIYVITHISGIDVTDAAHQVRLGYIDGVTDVVLNSATVANAGDSVEYVGQVFLKETDVIFAEFRSAGASDEIQLNVNGYRIRTGT